MKINNILGSLGSVPKNIKNKIKQAKNNQSSVNYNSMTNDNKNAKVKAALVLATIPVAAGNIGGCTTQPYQETTEAESEQIRIETAAEQLDEIAAREEALIAAAKETPVELATDSNSPKIELADVSLITTPVSEFYLSNVNNRVKLYPDSNIPTTKNGAVIVTITETSSDEDTEGNTLGEIFDKVFSNALSKYDDEAEKTAILNKLTDETIQANPELADYINNEINIHSSSYDEIRNLDLYSRMSSRDENLDTRLLTIPSVISYQVQGTEKQNAEYSNSTIKYVPVSSSASVIKNENELLDDEYSSLSDLIYASYGDDITDEGYRDILYAIVNAPENAAEFENILGQMNFNDIVKSSSINDLNRTLDENTSNEMIGLFLPDVITFRTEENNAGTTNKGYKDSIIYQLSPANVIEGQNERLITLTDNENKDGLMNPGDVFKLKDVLQFYISPDGNGRFANVVDGQLTLNDDVNYVEEFSSDILSQIVYANLDVFAAEYTDEEGNVHKYGVFDVNEDYDTKGKSLDEIIQNSTINTERMMNYSFVDEDGNTKFEDTVKLNLPQFNYRLNYTYTPTQKKTYKAAAPKAQTPSVVVKEPELIEPFPEAVVETQEVSNSNVIVSNSSSSSGGGGGHSHTTTTTTSTTPTESSEPTTSTESTEPTTSTESSDPTTPTDDDDTTPTTPDATEPDDCSTPSSDEYEPEKEPDLPTSGGDSTQPSEDPITPPQEQAEDIDPVSPPSDDDDCSTPNGDDYEPEEEPDLSGGSSVENDTDKETDCESDKDSDNYESEDDPDLSSSSGSTSGSESSSGGSSSSTESESSSGGSSSSTESESSSGGSSSSSGSESSSGGSSSSSGSESSSGGSSSSSGSESSSGGSSSSSESESSSGGSSSSSESESSSGSSSSSSESESSSGSSSSSSGSESSSSSSDDCSSSKDSDSYESEDSPSLASSKSTKTKSTYLASNSTTLESKLTSFILNKLGKIKNKQQTKDNVKIFYG